jgi:hypothetical protein
MTNRECAISILHFQDFSRLPIVHFGFWRETLTKWHQQGHLTSDEARLWNDNTPIDASIGKKLGFDFNWYNCFAPATGLVPPFEEKVLEKLPDGSFKVLDENGVIVLKKTGVVSIPAEIDHLLKDRKSWQEHYRHRLEFSNDRIMAQQVNTSIDMKPFSRGGLDFLKNINRESPLGLHCGSLLGQIRNWIGVEGLSYLYIDDEPLFDEIIDTVGNLCYQCTQTTLETGAKFDFAHFWEDICFKNGPLVVPAVFAQKVGPHYKRITDLVRQYGIEIVSVDCDGLIDALLPIWLENGVNTMFPIEVGTWNASIKPWREKYGRQLRGVGGMNKVVFAHDRKAIDAEVERLKPLVEMGGYIPCPDHRVAPDAKWENVQYYCEKMRRTFIK